MNKDEEKLRSSINEFNSNSKEYNVSSNLVIGTLDLSPEEWQIPTAQQLLRYKFKHLYEHNKKKIMFIIDSLKTNSEVLTDFNEGIRDYLKILGYKVILICDNYQNNLKPHQMIITFNYE